MILFDELATELHVKILMKCDLKSIGQMSRTSRLFQAILETNSIWDALNSQMFPNFMFTTQQKLDLGFQRPNLFFKFLKTNLVNPVEPLQITDASFECRVCIVVPYGIVAKAFSLPWISNPNILVYLRYDNPILGLSDSNLRAPSKISILSVISNLQTQMERNPFTQIRCTLLGAMKPGLPVFLPGERVGNVSSTFPSFIEPKSIDDPNKTSESKLRIFTILKTKNGQYLFYSGMNSSLGTSMKFFSQLNSHYLTFFPSN